MRALILMISFLTRIPMPRLKEFREEDFAKGLLYMPLVGGIIGLVLGLVYYLLPFVNLSVKGFLLLLTYLIVTGGLHLDGVSDYCDGVFSARDREGIFRIMKDSNVGTFGVIGLMIVLFGTYLGLKEATLLALVAMPVMGRSIAVLFCAFGNYPKEKGMGLPLIQYGQWYHGVLILLFLVASGYLMGLDYLWAVGITLTLMLLFLYRTSKVLGGITGDVLGAAVETSQMVWLISLLIIGGV